MAKKINAIAFNGYLGRQDRQTSCHHSPPRVTTSNRSLFVHYVTSHAHRVVPDDRPNVSPLTTDRQNRLALTRMVIGAGHPPDRSLAEEPAVYWAPVAAVTV